MTDLPELKRIAPDAVALRALAHPVRLRILSLLRVEGPSTATALAARLGLNSGATSYHLRLLARHDLIAEDVGQGTRRERWWQAKHQSTTFFEPGSSPEQYEASAAFAEAALTQQIGMMQEAQRRHASMSPEWQAATTFSDFTMKLTAEQAKALKDKLHELLFDLMRTTMIPDAQLPPGALAYEVVLYGFPFPLPLPAADPDDKGETAK